MNIPLPPAWLVAACAALSLVRAPAAAAGASVPSGMWAGDHVVMEVTSAGATVEFDCAHGTIEGALTLDGDGRFDAAGSFTPERGGPIRQGETRTLSARYTGLLKDSTLTVTVVLTQTKETVGVFTLRHGAKARLFKCK